MSPTRSKPAVGKVALTALRIPLLILVALLAMLAIGIVVYSMA
jgi:hypothetical protein